MQVGLFALDRAFVEYTQSVKFPYHNGQFLLGIRLCINLCTRDNFLLFSCSARSGVRRNASAKV